MAGRGWRRVRRAFAHLVEVCGRHVNDGGRLDVHGPVMWPFRFRTRLDHLAQADAVVLETLLGDAAYDHASRQVIDGLTGPADGMWPPGHWDRVWRELGDRRNWELPHRAHNDASNP